MKIVSAFLIIIFSLVFLLDSAAFCERGERYYQNKLEKYEKLKRAGIGLIVSGVLIEFPIGIGLAVGGVFVTMILPIAGMAMIIGGYACIGLGDIMWPAGIPLVIIGAIKSNKIRDRLYNMNSTGRNNPYYTHLYHIKKPEYCRGMNYTYNF